MPQLFDQKTLSMSTPYRNNFNADSFEFFRIHYPHLYEISDTGYRMIYKDFEKTIPSLYNKLGTNYTAYTYLVNQTIQKMLDDGVIRNVGEADPLSQNGYEVIINYLKTNKDFFDTLLPEIGQIIKKLTQSGDLAEVGSEDLLRKIFGSNIEIRRTAGLGNIEDTHGGKDRVIIKDGNAYNVQVKNCRSIQNENGIYHIEVLGAKLYSQIDIIIFKRGNYYFAFRSKDARGISTFQIFGNREGYLVPAHQLIKIMKSEPAKNIQNNA